MMLDQHDDGLRAQLELRKPLVTAAAPAPPEQGVRPILFLQVAIGEQRRSAVLKQEATVIEVALQLMDLVGRQLGLYWLISCGLLDAENPQSPILKAWRIPDSRPGKWQKSLSLSPDFEGALTNAPEIMEAVEVIGRSQKTIKDMSIVANLCIDYSFERLVFEANARIPAILKSGKRSS